MNSNRYFFFSSVRYKNKQQFPSEQTSGVLFASHDDYGYAIDDDMLLIGLYTNPVSDDVASGAAKKIFDKSKPSLLEKKEVAKALDVENSDITAYIDAKGLPLIFKDESRLNTIFGNVPVLDLLTGAGIKAVTAKVNFNLAKNI